MTAVLAVADPLAGWRHLAACRGRHALFEQDDTDPGDDLARKLRTRTLLAVGLHICRHHCTVARCCDLWARQHLGTWTDIVIAGRHYGADRGLLRTRPASVCHLCRES